MKASQIEAWLAERHGDAVVLGASPASLRMPYWRRPGGDSAARRRIAERLETLKRAYAYESFVVVDASAQQILAIGLHEAIAEAPVQKALQTALQTTRVATTDLYRSDSGGVHLDWVAPLVKEIDGRRQAVGAVILDTPVDVLSSR
ncbi:MAG: cache domain-containing protein [Sulfuritalea sp.]|nr:cache domain-containing protein [Sulfuritalea sp.]